MFLKFRQEALDEILGDIRTDYRAYLLRANKHKIIQLLDFSTFRDTGFVELDAVEKEINLIKGHCFAYYQLRAENFIALSNMLLCANIDFIMVKGLDVATRYYEKPWLRSFGDIDILIRGTHLEKTYNEFMKNEFFEESRISTKFSQSEVSSILGHCVRISEAVTFNRRSNCVDVHPVDDLKFDALLKSSIRREILGQSYAALSERDNLVLLLGHGQKHNWHKIRWIVDIFLILKKLSEVELLEHYKYCKAHGVSRSLEMCLLLSNYLFDFTVSEKISREILSLDQNSLLFKSLKIQLKSDDQSFKRRIFNLKTKMLFEPKLSGKILVLLSKVFFPTLSDFTCFVLPQRLHFLYYLVRPLRGLLSVLPLR